MADAAGVRWRPATPLRQERIHALPKLRQLGLRAFAAKQVAAELVLELLDGATERKAASRCTFRRPW
jgi:hypothetical protein